MATNTETDQEPTTIDSIERVKEQLSEKRLNEDRLVPLADGTKRSYIDHTDRSRRVGFDEWLSDHYSELDGIKNYGVYAGEGLLLIDIDDYDGEDTPAAFESLPDTLTVKTPHCGEHRYYRVPEDIPDKLEAAYGRRNPSGDWGEIRAHHQYVVGPGSQLDGCDKGWCSDCAKPNGGRYLITEDKPIAEIGTEDLLSTLKGVIQKRNRTDDEQPDTSGADSAISEEELDHDYPDNYDPIPEQYEVDEWVDEKALQSDETLRNLWDGKYAAEGYSDDRSKAEYVLASKLAFWVGPHKERVRRQLQRASTKKWEERDHSYRKSILEAVDKQDDFYSASRGQGTSTIDESDTVVADSEVEITLSDARQRTRETLEKAFQSGDEVLVEALPTLGKSYGAVKATAETGLPVTILTQRRDLYDEVKRWCDELGLRTYELPAMTETCPSYTEDPDTLPERQLVELYDRGLTPREIHETLDNLPCQRGGNCPSLNAWDFDSDEFDVLVGHYTQAKVDPLLEDRVVVFDECPDGVFDTTVADTVGPSVAEFLDRIHDDSDDLPNDTPQDYGGLSKLDPGSEVGRKLQAKIQEVITERDTWDTNGDLDSIVTEEYSRAHRRAPEVAYAVLCGEQTINGYERVTMDDGTTLLHDPADIAVHIRDPPSFENAQSVVCLDGTPTRRLWESTLGLSFDDESHETVLTTPERQSYVSDVQAWTFIQTTSEYVYNYTRRENVNVEKSAALIEAIRQEHASIPSLISTQACLGRLEDESVVGENWDTKHYGNLKSSNEFEDHPLGVVIGTRHFPREWIKREAAFGAEEIEPEGDGVTKTYNSEYGDALLEHMREHEVLQAAMRFGRDESTEACVYVHTACLPDWLPREIRDVEIHPYAGTAKENMVKMLTDTDPPWTVPEIADAPCVDVSQRQVGNLLNEFCDHGLLRREETTSPYQYHDQDLDSINQYGIVNGI